jgi:hypothetical protein
MKVIQKKGYRLTGKVVVVLPRRKIEKRAIMLEKGGVSFGFLSSGEKFKKRSSKNSIGKLDCERSDETWGDRD